jgi:hypothetical protein
MKGFDPEEDELDAERKKLEELALLQEMHDIERILSLPEGVRFFQRLLGDSGAMDDTFYGNSKDAYFAGRRSFALRFLKKVKLAMPDTYMRLFPVDPKPVKDEEDSETPE